MPTIHCPDCGRALNLPDGAEPVDAQCPLCRHRFVVNREPLPSVPVSRVVPLGPQEPLPVLGDQDARTIDHAAGWLRWAGIVFPLYGYTGGCFSCVGIARLVQTATDDHREVLFFLLLGWLVSQGVVTVVLVIAADRVRRRGGGWWVSSATGVLKLLGVVYLLGAVGLVFVPDATGKPFDPVRAALILAAVIAGASCLLIGRWIPRLLDRPAVAARLAHGG
jgi:hypothetical protein